MAEKPAAKQERDHDIGMAVTLDSTRGGASAQTLEVQRLRWGAGTVISSRYRVIEVVGAGGMGVVVRARDEILDRDVAVKLLLPSTELTQRVRERFLREARLMARIRHENVVSVFDFGETDGLPFLVMEYLPSIDLAAWLSGRSQLSVDEVVGILEQVCRGIEALHQAGVVHRDIKPSNILVGEGFRVAVADLGVAREALSMSDSLCRGPVGTPSYMAPEAVFGDVVPELARAVDVYSLSVLAFELLTSELPFPAVGRARVLLDQMMEPAPPVSSKRPELGEAFDACLLAGLSKAPDDRPRSALSLLESLRAACGAHKSGARHRRVVLADDDPDFLALMIVALQNAMPGVEVVGVDDGEAALHAIEQAPTDLALLDLSMPKMNGFEVTAALRSERRDGGPAIVIVTAVGGAADWRVLSDLGANGFLVKPLRPEELVASVRRILPAPY